MMGELDFKSLSFFSFAVVFAFLATLRCGFCTFLSLISDLSSILCVTPSRCSRFFVFVLCSESLYVTFGIPSCRRCCIHSSVAIGQRCLCRLFITKVVILCETHAR